MVNHASPSPTESSRVRKERVEELNETPSKKTKHAGKNSAPEFATPVAQGPGEDGNNVELHEPAVDPSPAPEVPAREVYRIPSYAECVENQNLAVVPISEEAQPSVSNAKLIDTIQNKIQRLMSNFFSIEKISMLTVRELQALDKVINTFSRSIKPVFNPQAQPKSILLP